MSPLRLKHIYSVLCALTWRPMQTITDVNYADDIALLVNTPAQAKTQLYSLEQKPNLMKEKNIVEKEGKEIKH